MNGQTPPSPDGDDEALSIEEEPIDPADLVSIADAAKELGRSQDWVRRIVKTLNIPKYKLPGDKRVFISKQDMNRLKKPYRLLRQVNGIQKLKDENEEQ